MTIDKVEENSMNEMMSEIEKSMKTIHSGDIVTGEVISVTESEVLVNIGYITDGIITKKEISTDEEIELKEILKSGDKIEVYIIKLNDGEGNVVLSKRKADEIKVWNDFEKALKDDTTFEVEVKEVVKGGVIVYAKDIRAFIPASHVSSSFVKNLNDFIGKKLVVKIIELNKAKKKIVLSRKEVEKKEIENKREKLWASLKKGEKRIGIVRRLAKFGAFVDLGGIDGLIHNSNLSWKRVNNPSEIVSEGDKVEVYVLDFDKDNGRISLGLKDIEENPWNNVVNKYKIDDILEGRVVRILEFGAFVEIESGVEGLVHITQITDENIIKPSQILSIGDKVKVKILDIKEEEQKISLSIKEALNGNSKEYSKYNDEDEGNFAFADLLKNFKGDK
ncbi:30S ribosomal protein S1 [Clostridium aestuarii]|uniref:30S ribosomal protein S1 n=1 Tax=Clostridium aestuarii TaxID=338193 RepID=A0ABT4CW54_9CLOT|nr:30S ribosomal protein S1 [Clostridium aestuarii]MCY6483196.1 30S ribosomal protein S1 [Clostridium aestuarii]